MLIDVHREVIDALGRIEPHVRRTMLISSDHLSGLCGGSVYLKLENLQHTGSFKVRGAMNKLLSMTDEERIRGVAAASSGNHGAAVAYCAAKLGTRGIVFVPEGADSQKVRTIEDLGTEVRRHGGDAVESERFARKYAVRNGLTYISPYNDPKVIGGQGTIAAEFISQCRRIDTVLASLGGGGLISGMAGFLKKELPETEIIGCSPENSQVMIKSIEAGRILDLPSLPTLSDGTAGGVEKDAVTFELCRRLVDVYTSVTEDEIADGLRLFLEKHHMLIEGAAAVSIAAFMKERERFQGKTVVITICGANISPRTLKRLL